MMTTERATTTPARILITDLRSRSDHHAQRVANLHPFHAEAHRVIREDGSWPTASARRGSAGKSTNLIVTIRPERATEIFWLLEPTRGR